MAAMPAIPTLFKRQPQIASYETYASRLLNTLSSSKYAMHQKCPMIATHISYNSGTPPFTALPSRFFFFSFEQLTDQDRCKPPFNASKTTKINAELGTLLTTVIPHPRYNPLTPYALQIALPSSQNLT